MQTALFRTWTQVADFSFYDDNHYTKKKNPKKTCIWLKKNENTLVLFGLFGFYVISTFEVTKDANITRQGFGLDILGCTRYFVHWLPWERCPWCSRGRRRKWTRRHEFKSWTWLIAFHIALIPLGKVWIQLFSLQLWVNSRTD